MKKVIIPAIILILAVGGYIVYRNYFTPDTTEQGEIIENEPEDFQEQYDDIAKYAYKGEINFRTLYMIFKPSDYEDEVSSEYECVIYEEDNGNLYGNSYYEVSIDGETVTFDYLSGILEFYMEGTYNGELTVNNVRMEKIDVNELENATYGYGNEIPTTNDHE